MNAKGPVKMVGSGTIVPMWAYKPNVVKLRLM